MALCYVVLAGQRRMDAFSEAPSSSPPYSSHGWRTEIDGRVGQGIASAVRAIVQSQRAEIEFLFEDPLQGLALSVHWRRRFASLVSWRTRRHKAVRA